jgi:drug/metabolite transporter (DMT)-like permease
MKTKTLGIVVAVLGILMIIYTGFSYVTTEKVVDLGPMQMSMEKSHPVQWSPIVGVIFLVGGIVILAMNRKK